MTATRTIWPALPAVDSGYADEFGEILPEVYEAARELWSHSERFISLTLGDADGAQRLMLKAAAAVSRRISQDPDQIKNPRAYLRRSFKRLALDELEKENGHRDKIERARSDPAASYLFDHQEEDLDRKILIQQIIRLMDEETREVFEMLAEEHTYEEIAATLGKPANHIRSRFSKQLKKIKERFQSWRQT